MAMIINDPELPKKIAAKLLANRKKREEQMTEEQREQRALDFLAEKAGYTEKQFSNMLNIRRVITWSDILRLSNALDVTPIVEYFPPNGGLPQKGKVKGKCESC